MTIKRNQSPILSAFMLLFLGFNTVAVAQTSFKYIPENHLDRYDYVTARVGLEDCMEDAKDTESILVEIPTLDPESADIEKEKYLEKLDERIDKLQFFSTCPSLKTLILSVGEATFLRKSDNFELYSKKYFKKGCPLNAQRFWDRYQAKFSAWFPGKTIIYADWGW